MIQILIAFFSGILTVFSPCVLPILPIILSSGIDGNTSRVRGVISGLIVSFTMASLLLASFVRAFGISAESVRIFAVALLLLFGTSLVIPSIERKLQAWIEKFWHFQPKEENRTGFWGGFLTGTSLGLVWTPCIGPILASVATLAAIGNFSLTTIFIASAYALGTGLPLFFLARGGSALSQKLVIIKEKSQEIRQLFGLIILVTALFIWTGADRELQSWTLSHLPDSWTQLAATFEKWVMLHSTQ